MNCTMTSRLLLTLCLGLLLPLPLFATDASAPGTAPAVSEARVWEEKVTIPTYLAGDPDPNPMFFFGRAYQGAEGRVYPYALYDTLTGKKVDKEYTEVFLENEYVKIGILPEIGGRIFMAVDKSNNYDFFYRQHVIKPALIGMLGAWISGGVEWNIPHHHRASSFMPVQYRVEENPDGSKTVWVGEMELRDRTRWAVGYTLRPGKSYLEAAIRIVNRTPVYNTMLCFANVAVHCNKDYQIIYPPTTQFTTGHSKVAFDTWPVATTKDDLKGLDVSWYKNHSGPNSLFCWNYEEDFFAGYDHGKEAGTMSVANHHVVPGKKFFTWGTDSGGQQWEKNLTDSDGPYLELMVGAYSDNQPDYSWLQPYETKKVSMFWYPFRDIGGVKRANLEAAVNLETSGTTVNLGFNTTAAQLVATVLLKAGDKVLLEEKISIAPDKPYVKKLSLPAGVNKDDLRASLSVGGKELVAYQPVQLKARPLPEPVTPPTPPADTKTVEELYLNGLRVAQFHNPSQEPDPYWEEALKRDPGDIRVNNAMGVLCLKKCKFADAERYFKKALERLTANYTSPRDGEPFYYLGVALKMQGKNDEAWDAFYKATWSQAWTAASYYGLAEIASQRGDFAEALELLDRSLEYNTLNTRALNLKAATLRHLDRPEEAVKVAASIHAVDPLDVRALAEIWLAGKDEGKELISSLTLFPEAGLEIAAELGNAGLYLDGTTLLEKMAATAPDKNKVTPMAYYYLGYFAEKMGQTAKVKEYYALAEKMPPDFCFPFQWEVLDVLTAAQQANPKGAHAPYYLSNLLYDWQPAEAMKLWEKSSSIEASFPIVQRNLSLGYSHMENGLDKAIANLEKAASLNDPYAVHFFELDQLYEMAGASPEKRLAMLEKHQDAVVKRDDAVSRLIELKVLMGKGQDAIALLTGRQFNVWEGGARFNVQDSWTDAWLQTGHQAMADKKYQDALADYQKALEFPANLRAAEGRRAGSRAPEVDYWIGLAQDALGNKTDAEAAWKRSSDANIAGQMGGSDIGPQASSTVMSFYQGMSLVKLGQAERAKTIFQGLVNGVSGGGLDGRDGAAPSSNFFAKFGQQLSQNAREARQHYTAALGHIGLGDRTKAQDELTQTLKANPAHMGARTALIQFIGEK